MLCKFVRPWCCFLLCQRPGHPGAVFGPKIPSSVGFPAWATSCPSSGAAALRQSPSSVGFPAWATSCPSSGAAALRQSSSSVGFLAPPAFPQPFAGLSSALSSGSGTVRKPSGCHRSGVRLDQAFGQRSGREKTGLYKAAGGQLLSWNRPPARHILSSADTLPRYICSRTWDASAPRNDRSLRRTERRRKIPEIFILQR